MKRNTLGFSDIRKVRDSSAFLFFFAILLCGLLAGCFTGMHIPQNDDAYMNSLAELMTAQQTDSFHQVAVSIGYAVAWPMAAIAVGFGRARALWLSSVVAARGFLLAFVITASIIQSGEIGGFVTLVASVIPACFTIPALLLLCSVSLIASQRAGKKNYWSTFCRQGTVLAFCCLLVILAIVWRMFAVPFCLRVLDVL